jgi:hypothetical protein
VSWLCRDTGILRLKRLIQSRRQSLQECITWQSHVTRISPPFSPSSSSPPSSPQTAADSRREEMTLAGTPTARE